MMTERRPPGEVSPFNRWLAGTGGEDGQPDEVEPALLAHPWPQRDFTRDG